jgi:signal transduction histidine kinase
VDEDDVDRVTIDIATDLEVQVDQRRFEQVVANLVENALTHGAGRVVVAAATCGPDTIELTVDDHGSGVDPALRPTLFTRVRSRGRDGTRGGGLGLVLVRGLVEAMGGRVWYTERAGGGSSFHLTLSTPRRYAELSRDDD